MKIAIATHYWQDPQGGGLNEYLTELIKALKLISKRTKFIIIYIEGNDPKYYKVKNGRFSITRDFYSILKKIQPDVIIVQENKPLLFGAALYSRFHKSVKLFFSIHTEQTPIISIIGKIKNFFMNIPYQWALDKCDSLVLVSKYFENQLIRNLKIKIRTNKVVIYPGVNPRKVTSEDINDFYEKFSINRNSKILLIQGFTAFGLKSEGVKLVMRSFKKLIEKNSNMVLIITREGFYTNELRDYSRKIGVYDNCIFTGDLENPFIPLEMCDIFVWPWLGETGVGMALLEAMLIGKPIIGTSVYGYEELLINEKTGLTVQADEDDIFKGITRLLENDDLRLRLGTNAKQMVKSDLTWEKSATKWKQLWVK